LQVAPSAAIADVAHSLMVATALRDLYDLAELQRGCEDTPTMVGDIGSKSPWRTGNGGTPE
jgi:hypothetical protein